MTSHISSSRRRWVGGFVWLLLALCSYRTLAEQQANDDAVAQGDDAAAQYNNYDNAEYNQGDDYIKYWTDYALLPKRCIV